MNQAHQVRVILRDGMHFEGFVDGPDTDRFAIQLDADSGVGGQGLGLRPATMLLFSLAGCMSMDVISILRKKHQQISAFEVSVSGERAEEHPQVYTNISVTFHVTGKSVDKAAIERAIQLSYDKYCPIANLLKPVVPIQTHYEIAEG